MSRRITSRPDEERPDVAEDEPRPTAEPDAETEEREPASGENSSSEGVDERGLAERPPTHEELEALRAECSELRDVLLRRRADFENYRKRVERDRHAAAQEALAAVFREIVGTVDNLERALAAEGDGPLLRQGVELTHRELVGLLESHGVVAVDPTGEAFDPNLHQALVHEPAPGLDEGMVAEVFRKGYTLGNRLLRPALVKVAKGTGSEGDSGGSDGDAL